MEAASAESEIKKHQKEKRLTRHRRNRSRSESTVQTDSIVTHPAPSPPRLDIDMKVSSSSSSSNIPIALKSPPRSPVENTAATNEARNKKLQEKAIRDNRNAKELVGTYIGILSGISMTADRKTYNTVLADVQAEILVLSRYCSTRQISVCLLSTIVLECGSARHVNVRQLLGAIRLLRSWLFMEVNDAALCRDQLFKKALDLIANVKDPDVQEEASRLHMAIFNSYLRRACVRFTRVRKIISDATLKAFSRPFMYRKRAMVGTGGPVASSHIGHIPISISSSGSGSSMHANDFIRRYNPIAVCAALTVIEHELLATVPMRDFNRKGWSNSPFYKRITPFIDQTNRVSMWVATVILQQDTPSTQASAFGYFVTTATTCAKERNLNSCSAIISGCALSQVSRLFKTWHKHMDPTVPALLTYCSGIVSPEKNYTKARELIRKYQSDPSTSFIPLFPMLLRDLTFIEDGNGDYLADGSTINREKVAQLRDVFYTIHQSKIRPFDKLSKIAYDGHPELIEILRNPPAETIQYLDQRTELFKARRAGAAAEMDSSNSDVSALFLQAKGTDSSGDSVSTEDGSTVNELRAATKAPALLLALDEDDDTQSEFTEPSSVARSSTTDLPSYSEISVRDIPRSISGHSSSSPASHSSIENGSRRKNL